MAGRPDPGLGASSWAGRPDPEDWSVDQCLRAVGGHLGDKRRGPGDPDTVDDILRSDVAAGGTLGAQGHAAASQHEAAIIRERERGVAPPGGDARHTAQALAWQAERLCFRTWAQLPGALSRQELGDVCLEAYMRMIFLDDDPDPEQIP